MEASRPLLWKKGIVDGLKGGLARKIRAFVPMHISNRTLLRCYDLMAFFGVNLRCIRRNREWNMQRLAGNRESLFARESHYIENQSAWSDVRFGKKSMISQSGCGVIATYNALLALRKTGGSEREKQPPDMAEIISDYERRGAALGGKYGVAPHAIARYFRRQKYDVVESCDKDPAAVNELGDKCDAVIATVYNDVNDIMRQLHTVCVTKDTGKYYLHNATSVQSRHISYGTLWDAIWHISNARTGIVALTGIRKTIG